MFTFLRAVGLKPLEWTQALRMTKQGSPYVGTVLDTAFREAAAIVVLFTPDDEARLRAEFVSSRDPDYERNLTGQARPNVLFEAGMAFGKDPNSTVLVEVGYVRPFSDVAGRHVVHMSNQPTSRQELVTKLANAGCNVDTSGTDWLSAGDFDLPPNSRPEVVRQEVGQGSCDEYRSKAGRTTYKRAAADAAKAAPLSAGVGRQRARNVRFRPKAGIGCVG
jgi:hypothetical protein